MRPVMTIETVQADALRFFREEPEVTELPTPEELEAMQAECAALQGDDDRSFLDAGGIELLFLELGGES